MPRLDPKKPKKVIFEVGDLVKVNDNTYQEGMPPTRVGVVTGVGTDSSGFRTGVYRIMFASREGQTEMTFWHKFLMKVSP